MNASRISQSMPTFNLGSHKHDALWIFDEWWLSVHTGGAIEAFLDWACLAYLRLLQHTADDTLPDRHTFSHSHETAVCNPLSVWSSHSPFCCRLGAPTCCPSPPLPSDSLVASSLIPVSSALPCSSWLPSSSLPASSSSVDSFRLQQKPKIMHCWWFLLQMAYTV